MRILVLGAGFGGLELVSALSEALGDSVDVTLIDRSDAFVFGFSKIDVLFSRATPEAVRIPYRDLAKPGLRFVRQTVTAIDPGARRVTTDGGSHEADVLVVALGAENDLAATPGLAEGGNEFYTLAGAARARDALAAFSKGHAVIGICAAPYKCPPAPSETALLLHEHLVTRGVRRDCEITLVSPLPAPVPPSPPTSKAILASFAEAGIRFLPKTKVTALDPARRVAKLDSGSEMAYDLFLGVPKQRVPEVVRASGLLEGEWIPADKKTLATRFPGVYAIGDVAEQGTPMAGVFAEGAARALATSLTATLRRGGEPGVHKGTGSCYLDFGGGRVGRVDVDFFSGPSPVGTFAEPTPALRAEKQEFGASRRARWFGRP